MAVKTKFWEILVIENGNEAEKNAFCICVDFTHVCILVKRVSDMENVPVVSYIFVIYQNFLLYCLWSKVYNETYFTYVFISFNESRS